MVYKLLLNLIGSLLLYSEFIYIDLPFMAHSSSSYCTDLPFMVYSTDSSANCAVKCFNFRIRYM